MYKEKDLKRMSRKDLLQLLVLQSKKIDTLQEELNKANELVETKEIMLKEAGSIAEASLKINKVFEVAQLAADQYLENIKRLLTEQEKINSKLEKEKDKLKKKATSKKKKTSNKSKVEKES